MSLTITYFAVFFQLGKNSPGFEAERAHSHLVPLPYGDPLNGLAQQVLEEQILVAAPATLPDMKPDPMTLSRSFPRLRTPSVGSVEWDFPRVRNIRCAQEHKTVFQVGRYATKRDWIC